MNEFNLGDKIRVTAKCYLKDKIGYIIEKNTFGGDSYFVSIDDIIFFIEKCLFEKVNDDHITADEGYDIPVKKKQTIFDILPASVQFDSVKQKIEYIERLEKIGFKPWKDSECKTNKRLWIHLNPYKQFMSGQDGFEISVEKLDELINNVTNNSGGMPENNINNEVKIMSKENRAYLVSIVNKKTNTVIKQPFLMIGNNADDVRKDVETEYLQNNKAVSWRDIQADILISGVSWKIENEVKDDSKE
jgi:hypothetical protein